MSKYYDYDLIVIGSGSGGGVAASKAAGEGKKVAMFEKDTLGGECPTWACVPTKALLRAADVYETAHHSAHFGTRVTKPELNYKQVQAYKNLVVSRTGAAEGKEVFTAEGIDVHQATARFIDPHTVTTGKKRYSAAKFLIATGTSNFIPPIPGLETAGYITFREAIGLSQPPKSLFIIGGGPIGCEFAQIFSSFKTKVTIAEALPRLLANEDQEVGELVGAVFEDRGINVLTGAKVIGVIKKGTKKLVHYQVGKEEHTVSVDEILVATGKVPNTDLGLENAGVEHSRRGVKVNKLMQTTAKHIYAAGDVAGPYQFTHTASYQSGLAAHNMFHTKKKLISHYDSIPRCVFVVPEVASVGKSEAQLKEEGVKYRVGATPIDIIGRANTEDEFIGFVKVLTDKNRVLLGASIVSPRAGEMIHELVLAVNFGLTSTDVARTVHAFPTYSEAIKIACALVE